MELDRTTSKVRTRLVETADRLFYAEGIRAVGIDRIIAEAKVAKMSLYKHFPSKDDLIEAVLRHRDECFFRFFRSAIERHSDGSQLGGPLGALFAAQKEWFESPGFRGCAFINASVELTDPDHPAAAVVRDHKRRFHELIGEMVAAAVGGPSPHAASVAVLVEGAIVSAVIQRSADAADVARDAAFRLLGIKTHHKR